jgi:hypothetical protein
MSKKKTEREVVNDIIVKEYCCGSFTQLTHCMCCPIKNISCSDYTGKEVLIKKWLKDNPEPKEVKIGFHASKVGGGIAGENKPLTYAEKQEMNVSAMSARLDVNKGDLQLSKYEMEFKDGKFQSTGFTYTIKEAKVLRDWLIKMLEES